MPREKPDKSNRISTALPRSLYEQLQEAARRQRRSVASLLALIVEGWLDPAPDGVSRLLGAQLAKCCSEYDGPGCDDEDDR